MATVPVVLDTNAILLPFTQGTRLEEPLAELLGAYELHLPTSVLPELQRLSQNQGATGRAAKLALKLAERCVREPTGLMGDDGILEVARRLGAVVFTNDRKLQAEAAKSGLRVLVARERAGIGWYKGGSG